MISNLAIYKNVLKEMEFVNINKLSRERGRIFLKDIGISPDALPASGLQKGGRSYGT